VVFGGLLHFLLLKEKDKHYKNDFVSENGYEI
jgi:hypothetical protein